MLASRLSLAVLALLVAVPFAGCASPSEDESDDDEVEGVGETNDELRSTVSCKERTDTAYTAGRASPIQIIHVGGKPMSKPTGHAFLRMQEAANAAGVRLSVTSGFRTMEEQKHLYYCYTSGRCNSGNLAALPGHSNHQNGLALDLSTSTWLAKNAGKFGFKRTVPREAWHYEYRGADPGGPCSRGTSSAAVPSSEEAGADDDDGTTPAPVAPLPPAGGISWVAPAQDSTLKNGFVVKAHANKPGIVKMVYTQGSLDFGRSTDAANDFALHYTFQFMGDKTLTARGYDASGALIAEDHVDFTLTP